MTELFRRLVLRELRDADRLHGETEEMLLSWNHSGFSVRATEPILPDDTGRQEHLARTNTRAPLRIDAVEFAEKGQVEARTPFDPRTGQRGPFLDELELIRRLCAQIPAPGQHMVRYYGHYANRARGARGETTMEVAPAVDDTPAERIPESGLEAREKITRSGQGHGGTSQPAARPPKCPCQRVHQREMIAAGPWKHLPVPGGTRARRGRRRPNGDDRRGGVLANVGNRQSNAAGGVQSACESHGGNRKVWLSLTTRSSIPKMAVPEDP